jgi:hypothetical protein
MMDRMSAMADDVFAALWNSAASVDQAVERVREIVAKAPESAVVARASALRRRGVELTHHGLRGT